MPHDAARAIRAALADRPRILVVCTGNICRSPMGEVVLRECLYEAGLGSTISVESCGVSSEETGNPIYPPAAQVLREAGYSVPQRSAHRATFEELAGAGLVLAMTVGHARSLRSMMNDMGLPLEVVHLWREFDGSGLEPAPGGVFGEGGVLAGSEGARTTRRSPYSDYYTSDGEADVPDPWYGPIEGYRDTLRCVQAGARGIVELLVPST